MLIVFAGLLNSIPGIPGLDDGIKTVTGLEWVSIRKFPAEWSYPIVFFLMMACVALKHSIWVDWTSRSALRRRIGLIMDAALVLAALAITLTYVVEIESICLVDRITGDRARLINKAPETEKLIAETMRLPAATTVEDPQCLGNTGGFLVLIVGITMLVFRAYNVKVWGLPIVLVALFVAFYTIETVLVWYFHGAEDINK
ncbi:MAG: hypothetical protein OXN84_18810 [Albidovulum sp.]|nr:hypothetical protein [Albidovulum sp.]